jgi:predicted PurR-regulated permease PerM
MVGAIGGTVAQAPQGPLQTVAPGPRSAWMNPTERSLSSPHALYRGAHRLRLAGMRIDLSTLEDKTFISLVIAISLAFAWILWPFYGAVLWGTVLAIVFAPLYRRFCRAMRQRPTLAALATVAVIVLIVILPSTLVMASLVREATSVYAMFKSGEVNLAGSFQHALDALPAWAVGLLDRFGMTDLAGIQEVLSAVLGRASQLIATQALNVGQATFELVVRLFVMLYLLFFLLRDGEELFRVIKDAVPLRAEQQRVIFGKFATVVRATVKGTIVVAILQGALGGLMFWFLGIRAALLWAALMALLSLLPAVGSALVWLPVALYLLATGALWQGLVLIAYGVLVIGLVDNLLRPMLVGTDIKMPDYVVLLSTLGGLEIFGMNGIVLGPLIAAMFMVVWDILSASRHGAQGDRTGR